MDKKPIFLVLIFLFPTILWSQILRVDKGFLSADSSGYVTGMVDATFAINNRSATAEDQNVYVGVNNNADIVYIADRSATFLISGINYFKIGDGPLIYNGSAHLRHVLRRNGVVTPEFFAQGQFDESRNMQSRWLLGGGIRWNILQKQNSLYAGLGAFREHEMWNGPESEITKELWKLNTYLSADVKLNSSINVNAIVYFQSGRDQEISAFRNRLSGHLEFKNAVTDHVKVKMTANFLLDDRPIISLNEFIYEAFFGVEYSFN